MPDLVRKLWPLVIAVWIGTPDLASASVTVFTSLGDLPGGATESFAWDVSGDGTTVVGRSESANGDEAFRWTAAGGMVGLGDLPGGYFFSGANAVSEDGSVIVGSARSELGFEAFLWTLAGGMMGLGDFAGGTFYSEATNVSDDGRVVVGASQSATSIEAFQWTAGSGLVSLGGLPGMSEFGGSRAHATSFDGSVIAGDSDSAASQGYLGEPYVWTSSTGMIALPSPPLVAISGHANAMTPDGTTIVGQVHTDNGTKAALWTDGQVANLGNFTGEHYESEAFDVSSDGGIVVGTSYYPNPSGIGTLRDAFVWDSINGMRRLDAVLAQKGIDVGGWTLGVAYGISDDGRVIVGSGFDSNGNPMGWRIDFDERPDLPSVPLFGHVPRVMVAVSIAAAGGWHLVRARRTSPDRTPSPPGGG